MYQITVCQTRAQKRAFFRFARAVYPAGVPAAFWPDSEVEMRVCGRHAYLLALRDGAPAARGLVLGAGEAGYLSLFEALDADSGAFLCTTAREIARQWGCSRLTGPLPFDGSGFGLGALVSGSGSAPWQGCNPPYYADAFARAGFSEAFAMEEYALGPEALARRPYAGAREWARARFGVRVLSLPLNSREMMLAALSVSGLYGQEMRQYERVYGRVCQLAHGTLLLAEREGVRAGFLLTVREGETIRVLSAHIAGRERGGLCAAALGDALWQLAGREGARSIATGTIDVRNAASQRLVKGAGGRRVNLYRGYSAPCIAKI